MDKRIVFALITAVLLVIIVIIFIFAGRALQPNVVETPPDPEYTVSGDRKVSSTVDELSGRFLDTNDAVEIEVSGRLSESCSQVSKIGARESEPGIITVFLEAVSAEPYCENRPQRFTEFITLPLLENVRDSYEIVAGDVSFTVTQ